MTKMKEVERRVAFLLNSDPSLRNDDELLIRKYRRIYDKYDVPEPSSVITSGSSIERARQKLQATGYFLPTDPKVIKKRRKQTVKMRTYALQ